MKKTVLFLTITIAALVSTISLLENELKVKESITFFPLDPSIQYKEVSTALSLNEGKLSEKYSLVWRIQSALEKDAYLRQDIGLLFANGRLIGKLGEWEQNTDQVVQEESIHGKESGKYEAISFHHSEIHQKNDQIYSSQQMSSDYLYIIDSTFSPLNSFRNPSTKEEREWKDILNQITSQQLQFEWDQAFKNFGISEKNYHKVLLTELTAFNSNPIPEYTREQSAQIIGRLWEVLYKNYFLGIKKRDGSSVDPIGSTIPLILIPKDKSDILVLTETADGETVILRQHLPNSY